MYVKGPWSSPEEVTLNHVIDGVTRKESSVWRLKTLPANGPENGAVTVAPARTVSGTLIVIVVSNRESGPPGGDPRAKDWILTEATVRRISVEARFVTVMMPTIFPSGPDGWTRFWTVAVNLRLGSSMTVTVI